MNEKKKKEKKPAKQFLYLSSRLFIVISLFTLKQFESFGNGIKFISVRFSACLAQFCNPLSAPPDSSRRDIFSPKKVATFSLFLH